MMQRATADVLGRAVAFMRDFDGACAGRAVRCEHGTAYFCDDLPLVWDLNQLSVDLGISAGVEELAVEADSIQGAAGLQHRKIGIDDELGTLVAPGFRDLGWTVSEYLVMPHAGPVPAIDFSSDEITHDELVPLWTIQIRSNPDTQNKETVRQLVEAQLRRRQGTRVRYFATRVGGEIAGYCELFSDGRTGQIESVFTVGEFRGRGLGKAVVGGALAASQAVHDFTFLVADADDWPREMYQKLGFEPAGSTWGFVRRPSDA